MYNTTLSQKYVKDMGLCKKKNKRCMPQHASACQKKEREKMHTQRRYATCLGMSKKRRRKKRQPLIQKERKRERWCIQRSSYTIHQKLSTHLHILIKVYDLFLLWIRSLTQQNMRSRYAFKSSIPIAPQKQPLEIGCGRKAQ